MQLRKMREIINDLEAHDVNLYSHIYATGAGELALTLTGQPDYATHRYLQVKGFVPQNNGDYVYRPPERRRS